MPFLPRAIQPVIVSPSCAHAKTLHPSPRHIPRVSKGKAQQQQQSQSLSWIAEQLSWIGQQFSRIGQQLSWIVEQLSWIE